MPEFITVKLIVGLGWLFSLTLHEFSHGLVAYYGGDRAIKERGYLTWNPLRYADPFLSFILPMIFLFMGGIGLPGGRTLINRAALRDARWDSAVSLAGPASNFLVCILLAILFRVGAIPPGLVLTNALAFLALVEVGSVILNLLPIPPLDGYGMLRPFLSYNAQRTGDEIGRYGIFLLFFLLWQARPLAQYFWFATYWLSAWLGIPLDAADQGFEAMRRWS